MNSREARGMDLGTQRLYAESATRHHDRLCPRQVLGVRMALHVADLLGLELPRTDRRLLVYVETDGCFVDGVAVATGCNVGKRTMRVEQLGKIAATFVDLETEEALRLHPAAEARTLATEQFPDLPRWEAQLKAYQTLPASTLLVVTPVNVGDVPRWLAHEEARRLTCDACREEVSAGYEVIRDGRTLCGTCAGTNRYYRPL
jgi:formylmethanofuran dehydrogenase subunit E